MIDSLKSTLSRNYTNARGWKTNKKIVVFESDDWGSIRMKDKKTFQSLLNKGIRVDKSKYDSLDCLESKEDLDSFFNILSSIKNERYQHPVFTFNTVMQNPDFDKIRATNFEKFVGEDFKDSYQRFYGEDYFYLWQDARKENLIVPQFHAKEHLNAYLWMKDLRENHKETHLAFNHSFFGLKTQTSSKNRSHYLGTYYAESHGEFSSVSSSLIKGLDLFNKTFGMNSETFIASNYYWPKELEKVLYENKVETIQGQRIQLAPELEGEKLKKIAHFTGQKNKYNQVYTVRNVVFEPYLNNKIDWAKKAFEEIENAFRWKTPAIISSHRINYVGGISEDNRTENLFQLEKLLKMIVTAYPTVEFLSSSELSSLLRKTVN